MIAEQDHMITVESFNLILLCGGHTLCTPENWNKQASAIDHCFKLYFPVAGSARIRLNGKWHTIEPQRYYFICGFHIEQQQCPHLFDVYWVHFIPTSLGLRHMLLHGPSLFAWPEEIYECHRSTLETLPLLFEKPNAKVWRVAEVCRVHAMLLHLIADYLRENQIESPLQSNELFMRIKPSIDFMNENIHSPLSLADIAARAHLAPTYFHKVFRELFQSTPLAYLTRRRLDVARQLLSSTSLPVKEVAHRVGYDNEFYFSRLFRRHFAMPPRDFKNNFSRHI
jgi:AraC-like DNA-binding protein